MAISDELVTVPQPLNIHDILQRERVIPGTGQRVDSLQLDKVVRNSAKKKVERRLRERIAEERGIKPSDVPDADLQRVTLLDLEAVGVTRKEFEKPFRERLKENSLLIGNELASPEFLTGAYPVLDPEHVPSEAEQTINALEMGATELINQGVELLGGDTSSPLAQDILLSFNEMFTNPLSTTGGLARSGEAGFARSIGARQQLLNFGSQLTETGIQQLGIANPTALPGFALATLQQAHNESLFGGLLESGLRRSNAAARELRVPKGDQYANLGVGIGLGILSGSGGGTGLLSRNREE